MSLEKSMETLAESNLKLAASFDRYAEVVERFGLKIEKDNEGKQTVEQQEATAGKTAKTDKPAATEKKPAGRPKTKPAPVQEEEDDGLGDDDNLEGDDIEAPAGLTIDLVKKKLLEVKTASGGDKGPAMAVIAEFGYNSVNEVKEKHYDDIWIAAERKLRSINE